MPDKPIDTIAAAAASPIPAPDLRVEQDGEGEAYDVVDLGPTCPVQPLGFYGQRNFFLDFANQLIELGTEFRKGECMMLFGTRMRWLEKRWPTGKMVKDKATGHEEYQITGFDQKEAQKGLIGACARQGLFDPTGKVRGRGAHVGDDGALYLHCGDQVLVGGRKGVRGRQLAALWSRPGLIANYVYPAAPTIDHPADVPADTHVAHQVLELLKSWTWKRPSIDPYLTFCWIAAAPNGGAFRWRPHAWITGPSGAGKTTLQKFIEKLLSSWALRTEDATEAGVRQLLSQDTLAVCFDEIEPDEGDGSVHNKIVKLARLASSGGSSLRGTQDHKSRQFVARSCFLFSSIHHHELAAQDRNRISILHLSKFPSGTKPLILPETLAAWGSALRRRFLEQWPRFDATLLAYQREMLKQGYDGREQDQYGTLLACGDLLLHDDVPPDGMAAALNSDVDRCNVLVRQLASVLASVRNEAEDTTERCLRWMTSHRLPARGGDNQETIGNWIGRAFTEAYLGEGETPAQRKLLTHGLKLIDLAADHAEGNGQGGLGKPSAASSLLDLYVAVANKTHRGTSEIFEASDWKKGIWTQALSLATDGHGNNAHGNKKARFDSPSMSCVVVPLAALVDVDALIDVAKQKQLGI